MSCRAKCEAHELLETAAEVMAARGTGFLPDSDKLNRKQACDLCEIPQGGARSRVG